MITLDLSILNQKGTPMFFSDLTANRPAAGIVGRIFIATDSPYGIFRDTGTGWDQVSGAGSFSGSLATGQVAFGSATNTISGTNNLFWDNSNNQFRLLNRIDITAINASQLDFLQVNARSTSSGIAALYIPKGTPTGIAYAFEFRKDDTTFGSLLFVGGNSTGPVANKSVIAVSNEGNRSDRLVFRCAAFNSSWAGTTPDALTITPSSNVIISGTTTPVDAGQRFQVYGDTFLKGSGNTSATFALSVQDSAGLAMFRVRNDNKVIINQLNLGNDSPEILPTTSGTYDINGASIALVSSQANYGLATYNFYFRHVYGGRVNTSGTSGGILQSLNFVPTSGTGVFNQIALTGTINQTGGANGITRGLHVNPTLTAAADWRSIEWSNNSGWGIYGAGTALNYLGGSLGIKTTSPYAPSTFSLDVNGGLLVKNTAGTTAQITLINADPSIGGNNGFLVASVGGTSGGSYVDFQGYYGTSIVGSTALRLNPAGGAVIVNSTINSGEQFQLTGTIRVNGQTSATSGGVSGQHLIINCDGVQYKIELRNP